jgi:hypothetical protein
MFRTGSNIYIASQAPKYPTGFGTGLGISVAAIIMAFVLRKAFERENNKRRAMLAEEGEAAIRARYSEQEVRINWYKGPRLTKTFANPSFDSYWIWETRVLSSSILCRTRVRRKIEAPIHRSVPCNCPVLNFSRHSSSA